MGRLGSTLALVTALAGCGGAADDPPSPDSGAPRDAAPDPSPDAAPDDPRPGLAPGQVRYVLDWDDTGLDVAPDGTWRVTNDLGQTFTITRGWLTSYSAQLVPCSIFEGRAASLGDWLWALVGGVAHAGHDDEPDPSLYEIPHVEPLVGRMPLVLGVVDGVPSETYCKVFYLVARSDEDAVGVPTAVPYARVSLYLEGTWSADGEAHAFTLSTDLNIGRNLDLLTAEAREAGDALRLDPTEAGVDVIVYRRIAGWFDGLDLAEADDALARSLMPRVVDALWAEVQ